MQNHYSVQYVQPNGYYQQPPPPTIGQKIGHVIDHLTGHRHQHHNKPVYIAQPVYIPVLPQSYPSVGHQHHHQGHHGHHGGF